MKKTAVKKSSSMSSSKSPRKRKKKGFSDGMQAFLLVGLIVVSATAISLTIISIHSAVTKKPNFLQNEDRQIISGQPSINDVPTLLNENQSPAAGNQPLVSTQTPITSRQPEVTTQSVSPENKTPIPSEPKVPPQSTVSGTANRNTTPSRPAVPDTPAVTSTAVTPKAVENKGTVVFVIDDAGNNLRELDPFLQIPGPLTIAVLPGLPYSAEAARRIRAAGKEVILHQPMEAIGGQDPGPGAINSVMSADEIKTVLARNIAEVGPVTGINNHQGSKITMDRDAMRVILEFCKENKIYYLDSRTTADTVVPSVAQQIGIKIAQRNVFIDNEQNKAAMLRYISGGLAGAQRSGLSVMIGHTWSPDLAPLLTEQYPLLAEQGYTIKTASDVVK